MSKSKDNKLSEFFLGKGFYLVLALCIMGAGVAGYMTLSGPSIELPQTPDLMEPDLTPNDPIIPQIEATIPQSSVPVLTEEVVESQAEAVAKAETVPLVTYQMPVEGEIIKAFSGDELVKNETLGDWRTHNGIDIACEQGQTVVAAGAGTITDVRNDALWGYTVVITHEDGVTTTYCGLASTVKVGVNQTVQGGDELGTVDYIPSESKQEEHLHFEATLEGQYIDPQDLMEE